MNRDISALPEGLPIPIDDGQARHLQGALLPELELPCTNGRNVSLHKMLMKPSVLFFYPRTGIPGQAPNLGFHGEDWDDIPGARGCTPQNCGFRDLTADFAQLGVQIFGVSTQDTAFQREFKQRQNVQFEYLSDVELRLVEAMRLPTFQFPIESGGPNTLIKRMSWFVFGGRIEQLWYPVFPSNEDATRVLGWLRQQLVRFTGQAASDS